jgi:hypothetical protein
MKWEWEEEMRMQIKKRRCNERHHLHCICHIEGISWSCPCEGREMRERRGEQGQWEETSRPSDTLGGSPMTSSSTAPLWMRMKKEKEENKEWEEKGRDEENMMFIA